MKALVIVFVYNRIDHVKNLIESLAKKPEAKESILYIFSDAAKNEAGKEKVDEVREFIESISDLYEFKDVIITKAEKNKGLAKSIIEGVTRVMDTHGSAIITEDDNVLAKDFLDYMNRALEFYKDNEKIWAISGFSRTMPFPEDYKHDIYMMQRMSSCAWASWKECWDKIDWEMKDYPGFFWNIKKRKQFAQYGEDRPYMLDAQMCGKIGSWAIRFEYSMMKNNKYSILPCQSRVINSGNDGSGTNTRVESLGLEAELPMDDKLVTFEDVEVDERIRKEYCKVFAVSRKRKLKRNLDYVILYLLRYRRIKRVEK